MAVPARPTSGLPVATDWGQVAHDTGVAMDIQYGRFTTQHTAANVSPGVTVTFPRPFASAPSVVLSSDNFNYVCAMTGAAAGAASFQAATKRVDGSAPTSAVPCEWVAYGPRA